MRKNFFSILITNFNKAPYLQRCINSLLKQNYNNYEIILYDDYSTDNSMEIIKKFKKVKLISNKIKNKKNSSPINQIHGIISAFQKSKGNIISLLDADDYFKKEKLILINKMFNENKHLKCIYDLPITSTHQFKLKSKKLNKLIWPSVFPTSCISVKKKYFINFLKHVKKNEFLSLEIDTRISIFFKFYFNEYNIMKKKLTYYSDDDKKSITSKINKFSLKWWQRRSEAFEYLRYILNKKKIKFRISFDYLITKTLTFFHKFV